VVRNQRIVTMNEIRERGVLRKVERKETRAERNGSRVQYIERTGER
jgi:hypothetical protein